MIRPFRPCCVVGVTVLALCLFANLAGRWTAVIKSWNAFWSYGWPYTFLTRDGWKSTADWTKRDPWILAETGRYCFFPNALVADVLICLGLVAAAVVACFVVCRLLAANERGETEMPRER